MRSGRVMTPQDLQERTLTFAVDVGRLIEPLFASVVTREHAAQLSDASASTASNYRAACNAKSHADFIAKVGIALEEADESHHWLTFLRKSGRLAGTEPNRLIQEALELSKILGASVRTAKRRRDSELPPRGRRRKS